MTGGIAPYRLHAVPKRHLSGVTVLAQLLKSLFVSAEDRHNSKEVNRHVYESRKSHSANIPPPANRVDFVCNVVCWWY